MAAQPAEPDPTGVPNVDNPFLVQEEAAGGNDPPAAPSITVSIDPPDYNEAVQRSSESRPWLIQPGAEGKLCHYDVESAEAM